MDNYEKNEFDSLAEMSDEFAETTGFGDKSVFHHDFKENQQLERYKRDVISLMNKNCIDEFFYTHNSLGEKDIGFVVHATKKGNDLIIRLVPSLTFSEKETFYYTVIKEKCGLKVSVRSGGNFVIKNKNQKSWKVINSGHFDSFPFNKAYYANKYRAGDFKLSLQEVKQVAEALLSRKDTVMLCSNYFNFNDLANKIQEQLSKQFYSNVNTYVYIKQVDSAGRVVNETQLTTNGKKPFDIKLNITVKPNGEVIIKHVASNNLMKQYVDKWKKEAADRGLDIDIEELRKQVIKDFESVEVEKSFYQRFIQDTKALLNDRIAGYVEGVQVTQKIAKNVWEEGTINQSTWFTKDKEHIKWPEYAQLNPIIGGVTDGAVDEIAGIPLAVKGIYEIVTDKEKQEGLLKVFTKEGAKQMIQGLAKEASETLKDKDKTQHFAGKTVVSVATMLSGVGFMNKSGKMDDVMKVGEEVSGKLIDPKAAKVLEDLRKAERYKPEILKSIEGYLEGMDQKILGKIAGKPNFDLVLKEMAEQWKKFHGSKFMLRNLEDRGDDFVSKINKFEAVVIDEANFAADIELSTGHFLEYKSWKKNTFGLLNGEQAQKQLKNYINSGKFEYVVDKQKLLKDGVLDPDKFVKDHFQKVFKANADTWFVPEELGGIIKDKTALINLFGTQNLSQIKAIINNSDHPFYKKIIKVE